MDRVQKVLQVIAGFSEEEKHCVLESLSGPKASTVPVSPAEVLTVPQDKVRCPDCDSFATNRFGRFRGLQRYKCISCSRTFNSQSATPMARVRSPEKFRRFAAQMAQGGVSLRKSAKDLNIDLKTALRWRHRIIQGYAVAKERKLRGIAEADETFFLFSEKGDKTVSKRRKPRKRGGKAKTAGISDNQVPVIVGCDRQGELVLGATDPGRISMENIEEILGDRIDEKATLCTDSHSSFRAFAKANHLKYRPVNVSKGQRVVKKVFHIQHVNSAHSRLKGWMGRFRGVSTKHLDSYAQWFGLLEETKNLPKREENFIARSVAHRLRK